MSDSELVEKYNEFIEIVNEHLEQKIVIVESSVCQKTLDYYNCIYNNKKFKKYLLERRENYFTQIIYSYLIILILEKY